MPDTTPPSSQNRSSSLDPSSWQGRGCTEAGEGGPSADKSRGSVGGAIPGRTGVSAFSHIAPNSMPLPVLIAVPHAGRAYPLEILERMRDPTISQLRLEDRYVDKVGAAVARETGTGLLVAHAPRAMLDLNRAEDDVDWDMVTKRDSGSRWSKSPRSSGSRSRARSGLGLVPRRLPGFGEIWRDKLSHRELKDRIDGIHRPYHSFLENELQRIRDEWGAALLVDLHSMPPLRRGEGDAPRAQIVLGDRFGATCDGSLVAKAFDHFDAHGCIAAYNRPYSGGYVVDRHSAPARGIHSLQIELCRLTYLDDRLSQPTDSLGQLARMLAGMVRELGAQTALLGDGGQLAQAAE